MKLTVPAEKATPSKAKVPFTQKADSIGDHSESSQEGALAAKRPAAVVKVQANKFDSHSDSSHFAFDSGSVPSCLMKQTRTSGWLMLLLPLPRVSGLYSQSRFSTQRFGFIRPAES